MCNKYVYIWLSCVMNNQNEPTRMYKFFLMSTSLRTTFKDIFKKWTWYKNDPVYYCPIDGKAVFMLQLGINIDIILVQTFILMYITEMCWLKCINCTNVTFKKYFQEVNFYTKNPCILLSNW